jgi:hypothetical protein
MALVMAAVLALLLDGYVLANVDDDAQPRRTSAPGNRR